MGLQAILCCLEFSKDKVLHQMQDFVFVFPWVLLKRPSFRLVIRTYVLNNSHVDNRSETANSHNSMTVASKHVDLRKKTSKGKNVFQRRFCYIQAVRKIYESKSPAFNR